MLLVKHQCKLLLTNNVFGKILVLFFAPLLLTPAHFGSSSSRENIYRRLGFFVPLVPGTMFAWVAVYFIRTLTDKGYLPLDFSNQTDLIRYERLLAPVSYIQSNVMWLFFIYFYSLISWSFHQLMCYAFRKFSINVYNAKFQFFLVRNSGFAIWLAAFGFILAFSVSNLDTVLSLIEGFENFSKSSPKTLLLVLFMIVALQGYVNINTDGSMVMIYGTRKLYNIVVFVEICIGLVFLILTFIFQNFLF